MCFVLDWIKGVSVICVLCAYLVLHKDRRITQRMDQQEKNRNTNKKILGAKSLIIIVKFLLVFAFTGNNNNTDDNKTTIKVAQIDFDRYGLAFDNRLYGWIDTNNDGQNMTYYLTKDQMAGLYYHDKTFQYDTLQITYHVVNDTGKDTYIVDKIYTTDGTEIVPVSGEDSDRFAANSRSLAGTGKCGRDFGKTTSEL